MLLGAVEACVAALVNKLASSFVQHVWKHNFSFGWWRGTIEVKDVAVQPDLLRRALGLPFVVLAGTVGALRVRIPWRALFSEPAMDRSTRTSSVSEKYKSRLRNRAPWMATAMASSEPGTGGPALVAASRASCEE